MVDLRLVFAYLVIDSREGFFLESSGSRVFAPVLIFFLSERKTLTIYSLDLPCNHPITLLKDCNSYECILFELIEYIFSIETTDYVRTCQPLQVKHIFSARF